MTIDAHYLLSLPPRITRHSYTRRDTMLYALGVGAGHDPERSEDLRFLFEDGLEALPTMAAVLAYPGFWQREPQYGIDWQRVLHAEQAIEFHASLPIEGDVRGEMTIDSIVDKGADKGALLQATRRVFDEATGTLLATVRQLSFLRGDGGCGGPGGASAKPQAIPEGAADAVLSMTTRPEQALIYRLSGDFNPLHAVPAVAHAAGLPRPILHGLCSYGVAGRAILHMLCDDMPARLKRLDCRFTAPVFPGDTLDVAIWRIARGRAAFRAVAAERGLVVMNNGYAEYEG